MKTVTIYTDGACSGNPGPGGWGAILMYGPHRKELSGGEGQTTNNRMELTGVITALEALKEPCAVELYSDSKYVIDGLEKGWAKGAHRWQAVRAQLVGSSPAYGSLLCPVPCTFARLYSIFMTMASIFCRVGQGEILPRSGS